MENYLITLSVLCMFGAIVVLAEFDKDAAVVDFLSKAEACKDEANANEEAMQEMLERKPASTHEGKCMHACIMKKYGWMDANGKFDMPEAKKHAEIITEGAEDKMKIAREIIEICGSMKVSDDDCEAAIEYGKCLEEQSKAHGVGDYYEKQ